MSALLQITNLQAKGMSKPVYWQIEPSSFGFCMGLPGAVNRVC
ncbi:hypothetical protein THIOSC13_1350082 [uncultured Thiomicrorhabdus sp.]